MVPDHGRFSNQGKVFDLYYSMYGEDMRFLLFVVIVLAEQILDENDVWGTLILHWCRCELGESSGRNGKHTCLI